MFNIVLYQPEIPPNTGNAIRLAANTGCMLHLIRPLGFALDEPRLRRAGLDYHEWVDVREHDSLEACLGELRPQNVWAFSRHATTRFDSVNYVENDCLLFGPETRGLPEDVLASIPVSNQLRLPMRPGNRSLNLSNAVAVAVYEAWRQRGYGGSEEQGARN